MKKIFALFLVLMLPALAQAWWNPDWSYRKMITLDTTPMGANVQESVKDAAVLVRLHTGNFGYFLDLAENGKDLRFIANDDKTPLKFHIESFDAVNQLALIWVKVPQVTANTNLESIWMYYGNGSAVAAADVAGTFDVNLALNYHFNETTEVVTDSTAYAANAATGVAKVPGLIGPSAKFDGTKALQVTDVPPLRMLPPTGWTFTAWVKKDQAAAGLEYLLDRQIETQRLSLVLDGDQLVARLTQGTTVIETPRSAVLPMASWNHVALTLTANAMTLYVNGAPLATITAPLLEMGGDLFFGGAVDGTGFYQGLMDEVQVSKLARSAGWVQAQSAIVGAESKLLMYGEDEQDQGGGADVSYFGVILQNVTLDGWVVIVILAIMAFVSWWVMYVKTVYIQRVAKHNAQFMHFFRELDHPVTDATGNMKHIQHSQLYQIYQTGMKEVRHRIGDTTHDVGTTLSGASLEAIRSALHATLTKQNQRLNAKMVLLTIAISGGPFLGLLGTVVGVMITFAAIAASGDVNINAIAPGIAAALVATVAGLAVAIPALFGYNYLGSRIKDISAELSVFVDEYVNKLAEYYSR